MNSKNMHLNYVNWYGKHRDENVQVSKAVLAHACVNILKFSVEKWLVESTVESDRVTHKIFVCLN